MANYSDIRYKRPSMGLKKGNIDITEFKSDNDDLIIETKVSDKDIHFKGSDDGSVITALTLDMSDGGSASFNHNVTVGGNLTVNGTTTTVNSTTLTVDDKNIELGSTDSPSDTSADGGGITLKGATDHTFNWVNSTDAWTSSEHINLASGKEFKINGTSLKDVSETLTNKTINSASNTITITESNISDLGSYITASSTDTLTNKTIDASSNTITGISSDLVNDTTPQLGGDLDLNSNDITGTGNVYAQKVGRDSTDYISWSDNSYMDIRVNGNIEARLEADGDFHADGDVIAYSTTISDIALKSDIELIPNALDKIDEVRGVTFTRHNGQKSAGIIAQELEKVLPCAVREKTLALVDGKKYKTVEYDAIHGLLINCIKELKEEIKELKNAFNK